MKKILTKNRTPHLSSLALALLLLAAGLLLIPSTASAASDVCIDLRGDLDADDPEPILEASATAPNCRYGVTASQKGASQIVPMKIGWVVTFGPSKPSWVPSNVSHTPMIRLKQSRDANGNRLPTYTARPSLTNSGLGQQIQANPGAVWIVGNEVDRVFWQDDLMPEVYADAYHDAYHFIKQKDPTAKVAVSGLVLVTPGRLQYLDKVLDAYRAKYGTPMPVDVWTFHAYIFPERIEDYVRPGDGVVPPDSGKPVFASVANGTDPAIAMKLPHWWRPLSEQLELCQRDDYYCIYEHDSLDLFAQQVVAMRSWMKARGYQNTPLLLTEWSLLHQYKVDANGQCIATKDEYGNCFTPQRVTKFMEDSIRYLENATDANLGYPLDNYRLVQQWAWFLLDDGDLGAFIDGNPSLLIDPVSNNLTQMGRKYRDLIAATTTQPNLVIDRVFADLVDADAQSGVGTAILRVSIRNNGNTPTAAPFQVKFYRDAGMTQLIGQATVPAGLEGCAVNDTVVEVAWENLNPGVYRYWVSVDSEGTIGASKTGSSVVIVDPERLFLPMLQR